MSVVSIDTLKGYFETGDKPTQQQFENLIDTLAANGLVILPAGTTQWSSPAGTFIDDIIVIDTEIGFVVDCGTTEGGTELLERETASNYVGIFPVKHYSKVDETIYFTGLNETAIIKLYIK